MDGIEHTVLDGIGKLRVAPPTRLGGPNGAWYADEVLVSTTRQGVIPTKTNELAGVVASTVRLFSLVATAARLSLWLGCQYSGAGQCFRGT